MSFNWITRIDDYDKPAGIFEATPFPIIESTTTYLVKNDENPSGKTYTLGTHYYVDGDTGNDTNIGLVFGSPKKTIQSAVATAGSGNKTIIVRGAHDSFDGVYNGNVSFNGLAGTDDTHRLMLVGYNQERPTIDMGGVVNSAISRGTSTYAYITVQRFNMTNGGSYGVRLGWDSDGDKRDEYFNCIDLHFSYFANSACYYLNTDYGWVTHCTVDHTFGHGFKLGDGASYGLVEWCISKYIGYWSGVESHPDYTQHSSVAFDFPNDTDVRNSHDMICRYNIGHDAVNYGLQLRRVKDFVVHHNEFYNNIHHDEITPAGGTLGKYTVILYAGQTDGDFYSNLVYNPASIDADLILVSGIETDSPILNIYNNIIYGATRRNISIGLGNTGDINLFNNSLYLNNSTGAGIYYRAGTYSLVITNNILYQEGTGECLEDYLASSVSITHTYNMYYAPNGTIGITLSTGEVNDDPEFTTDPPISINHFKLQETSPAIGEGIDNPGSGLYDDDICQLVRTSTWDIGAFEYIAAILKYIMFTV